MSDKFNNNNPDDDKIHENEGGVPTWFTWLFILSIIGASIYGIIYHFTLDWSAAKEYKQEAQVNLQTTSVTNTSLNTDGSNPYRDNSDAIAAGEKSYATLCAACHKADATGLIGPSLIDTVWLHGATDKAMYDVIMDGVTMDKAKQNPMKGPMPPHKNSLGSKKVLEVLAWMASKNPSLKNK